MKYVQCPDIFMPESIDDYSKTLFLGGGISNCPVWQDEAVELLKNSDFIVVNPRRKNFDISNKSLTVEQIRWEYYHLRVCEWKMFWFPKNTLCPITLLELGKNIESKNLYIGVENGYKKAIDVLEQTSLCNKGFVLVHDLFSLTYYIKEDFKKSLETQEVRKCLISIQ